MTNNVTVEPMPESITLEEEIIRQLPERALAERVIHLNRIMHSQARAIASLHRKLDAAAAETHMLGAQRDAANQNSGLQIQTTAHHIQQSAEKEAELVDEIRKLRRLLKRVKMEGAAEGDLLADIKDAL